ncbi:hypothetical protein GF322_02245 [Candidatus Dependentiae bacterium]|nr:hypothetical protein [Candidatus Dependentiae bacterium]
MIAKKITIIFISISLLGFIIADKLVKQKIYSSQIDDFINKNKPFNKKEHLITIFIHGTILPIPSTCALNYSFNKNTPKASSNYQKYLDYLRDEIYSVCQPNLGLGLKKINIEEEKNKKNNINYLYIKTYEQMAKQINHKHNITQSYYVFGWNGRLDHKKRIQAAEQLYKALKYEIENIKKTNPNQKIILELFGHSHGGNVILNLASIEEKFNKKLLIDKIILLGTPIQSETKNYIFSNIFKKIYNIYSKGDMIQVVDILSTKDSISQRKIRLNKKCNKLTQIQVQAGKMNPRHTELWLWGDRSPIIFRKNTPYYPFPVAVFLPIIIHNIEKNFTNAEEIKLDITKNDNNCLNFTFFDKTATNSNFKKTNSKHLYTLSNIEYLKNQIKQKIL